jgi:hypothetical protein
MESNKIQIQTPLGKLTAVIGGDPDYPEIFTYLERNDGIEIDLVAVSTDGTDDQLTAYLYGDTTTDCYTKEHVWYKDELNIDYEEETI